MLIVSDFQELSTVAENIDSLYDTITYDLGLEEWQQEKLVDELIYQFSNADNRMIELENENIDFEEKNDELEDENEKLENENFLYEEKNDELGDRIIALEEKNDELRNKLENIEKSKEAAYKAKLDKIKAILDDEELVEDEETADTEENQADVEDEQVATTTLKEQTLSTPWSTNVGNFSKMLANLKSMVVNAYKDNGKVIEENDPMLKTREFIPYATVVIKCGNTTVSEHSYRTVAMAKHTIKQTKARFKNSGQSVSYSLKLDDIWQWCIVH